MITKIENLLKQYKDIAQYQITETITDSYEVYFVHEKAETIRTTTSANYKVLIIKKLGDKIGTSNFLVQNYMNDEDIKGEIEASLVLCDKAVCEAYSLPENEKSVDDTKSNILDYEKEDLVGKIYQCFFKEREDKKASINALEVFVKNTSCHIVNSNGTDRKDADASLFIESIPTYTIDKDSVELYKSYDLKNIDFSALTKEIDSSLEDVKCRFYAKHPEKKISCKVIFRALEASDIVRTIARQLNYATIYSKSNVYKLGDNLQENSSSDKLNLELTNKQNDVVLSTFDGSGSSFTPTKIIEDGVVKNYYGNIQFATYLKLPCTGNLPFFNLECGKLSEEEIKKEPYLECASMSGIQVDVEQNYIGGEVRLGYYFDGKEVLPVSGISVSGKLSDFLSSLELSKDKVITSTYEGPKVISGKHFVIL